MSVTMSVTSVGYTQDKICWVFQKYTLQGTNNIPVPIDPREALFESMIFLFPMVGNVWSFPGGFPVVVPESTGSSCFFYRGERRNTEIHACLTLAWFGLNPFGKRLPDEEFPIALAGLKGYTWSAKRKSCQPCEDHGWHIWIQDISYPLSNTYAQTKTKWMDTSSAHAVQPLVHSGKLIITICSIRTLLMNFHGISFEGVFGHEPMDTIWSVFYFGNHSNLMAPFLNPSNNH